jgi:hypothetical protein
MTDNLVPDWIKNIQLRDKQRTAMDEAKQQRKQLLEKTVQADGGEFWVNLLKELQITADALSEIDIKAKLISQGGDAQTHMVELAQGRTIHTKVNFHGAEKPQIRCYPSDLSPYFYEFVLDETLSLAVFGNSGKMSPKGLAQVIVQPMVTRLQAR